MSTPTAVRDYIARGFAPIPVPYLTKRAVHDGWPELRISDPDVETFFPSGRKSNVGLLLGEPSAGLMDTDLDSPEALVAAPFLLPPTGMISGRESCGGRSHWWHQVTDAPPKKASENFVDPVRSADPNPDIRKKALLLELRSTGGQTIAPPSVYPAEPDDGRPVAEACVWRRGEFGEPTQLPVADLRSAVGAVAAAALLGRCWPKSRRHACALSLAGGLLRRWPVERVEAFVRAVCAAANDEEADLRAKDVHDTARRLAEKENVTGFPNLIKELGPNGKTIMDAVGAWLSLPKAERTDPKLKFGGGGAKAAPRAAVIPPYTPFPTDLLPVVVREYVDATAKAMNCDPAYSALPALAALGAAIGSSHVASPKKRWKEPPYIWALAIGKSGAIKSPPYRDVEDAAEDINDRLESDYETDVATHETRLAEWAAAKSAGEDPGPRPKPPVLRSFIKGDVTIEALVGELQDNPRGLFIGQDELSAWVSGFVKYSGKTGASDLQRWLQLHNAGTINYSRKTGDKRRVRVRGVGVSVAGTIQPKVLSRVLTEEFRASGFLARLLLAMPPWRRRQWTEAEVDDATRSGFADLLSELHQLPGGAWPDGRPAPHMVRLSDEAKAAFIAFYNANGDALGTADEDMSAAMSKLEGYALRFALIFHCCRLKEFAGSARITAADMDAAIRLTAWFRGEAERVYAALGETPEQQTARHQSEMVARLAERRSGRITAFEFHRTNRRKYPTTEAAEAILDGLVSHGFGDWETPTTAPTGGRPTRHYVPRSSLPETPETPSGDDAESDTAPQDRGERYRKPPDGPETTANHTATETPYSSGFTTAPGRDGGVSGVSGSASGGGEGAAKDAVGTDEEVSGTGWVSGSTPSDSEPGGESVGPYEEFI